MTFRFDFNSLLWAIDINLSQTNFRAWSISVRREAKGVEKGL